MSQTAVVDRIRQVAIVLTSVDAATARKLLGQLPESQARLVRQSMAKLGSVTPAEREAAMAAFVKLNRSMKSSTPASTAPTNLPVSPAEALLSNVPETIDRFEASRPPAETTSDFAAPLHSDANHDGFVPVQTQGPYPFASPNRSPAWQQWTGEDLSRMLLNERPNVIAALVLQCPTALGTEIIQALPAQLASSVLASLPQLHTGDAYVLQEIYEQLHTKLIDFQRQTSPANEGMTKLQSLLANLAGDKKQQIRKELARTDPMLAHSLGIASHDPSDATSPFVDASIAHSPAVAQAVPEVVSDEHADVADMIVPFVARNNLNETDIDETLPEPEFEQLVQFSPEDLAIVLRSLDPQTILLATAAAGPVMQARVEALIDANDVPRLRKRLHALRRVSAAEKTSAQQKIARVAGQLLQQGHIAGLSSVTIVAA